MELRDKIVLMKISIHAGAQFILVFISKLQVDVAQELVDVAQLKDLLVGDHQNKLELIVQFVFQRQVFVIESVRPASLLRNGNVILS